ncbi:MAG TPA: hypothetical protein VG225_13115 [Terracidiphilus sp.]|jgi:hypothetical protein|nr:hypothetical protein [Terracidiphilus sp.]
MIATTTAQLSFAVTDSVASQTISHRPRRISPQAGRALEKLSHAIEYLTDEYVHASGSHVPSGAQLQAIQLLMAIHRCVYLESPEIQPFSEHCRVLLRQLFA